MSTIAVSPQKLRCSSCGTAVELYAPNAVDPKWFRCEPCREDPSGQTALDVAGVVRVERRDHYDPRDARIPF
jgi:hypothetical protein